MPGGTSRNSVRRLSSTIFASRPLASGVKSVSTASSSFKARVPLMGCKGFFILSVYHHSFVIQPAG